MKRLLFVALLLASGHAFAQPPREVVPPDTIELRVDETRTFTFDNPINRISLSAKDIAEVIPESDRTINMRGVGQGRTLMTAYGVNNRVIYQATILVLQAGGFVRIYGQGDKTTKDFIGYHCNAYSCGRADKDLPQPLSTTVSETTIRGGASQTISRQYR